MATMRHATHELVPPLVDGGCRALLLGSMLSPKSAEAGFYYAHPQNRFWRVLSAVFGCPYAEDKEERAALALKNGIALWDVVKSCDIEGANDSSIKNVVYNDIDGLLKRYPGIKRVYATGGKAYELLKKYAKTADGDIIKTAVRLPSTSPLNCAMTLPALVEAYKIILQ